MDTLRASITNRCLLKKAKPPKLQEEEEDERAILCLPYIKGLSENIERSVRDLNVKTAFRPNQTIRRHLTQVKAPREQYEIKGVIYSIPCECGRVYIGETGRTLKQRISEHKRAVKNQDKNNGIAVHVLQTGNEIR